MPRCDYVDTAGRRWNAPPDEEYDDSPEPEPDHADEVRDAVPTSSPPGPPPLEVPEDLAARINTEKPFVELTLIHTGQYTGPTRGRMMEEAHAGFMLLTEKDGCFFIPWSNLAFWRFLPET